MDSIFHKCRKSTRAAAFHVALEHSLQLRSGRRFWRSLQPPAVPGLSRAAGRGLSAAFDRDFGSRRFVQDANNADLVGFLPSQRRDARQSVHQLPVKNSPRRRLSLHSERRDEAFEQPAGSKLFAELNEKAALSSGAARVFLEDLRLQQKVSLLCAEELGRFGHSGAGFVSSE